MKNKNNSHLVKKWGKLLKGIEDQTVMENTAILLENQARSIIHDRAESGFPITEATHVGQLGTFQKFSFPLVRRIFPQLIANKIIGTQPMQGPVSQVFYLGYRRSHNGTHQTIYSKYNMIYGGMEAGPNGNIGALEVSTDTAGAGSKSFSSLTQIGGDYTPPSGTVGGRIAAWPSGTAATYNAPWSVSAGEVLSGANIPEIALHLEQQSVNARTRKFRALWTIEAQQDLKAYHNLDLERELTSLLTNEVRLEIDRELIEDVRSLAYDIGSVGGFKRGYLDMGNSNNFPSDGIDFTGGKYLYELDPANSAATTLGTNPSGTDRNIFLVDFAASSLGFAPQHIGHVYSNLLAVVNFASQHIYKTTYRGPGNWIVTSPFMAAVMHSAAKLEGGIESKEAGTLGTNILYKGKWLGQFDVYVDPLYPEDEILMGYKGGNEMESGLIHCPYIPIQMGPTITNPEDFQPRKGLLTRYGKVAVTPEARFYRVIRVIGANSNYLITPFGQVLRS